MCHIANVNSESGYKHWNSVVNCSLQGVSSEGVCAHRLLFRNSSPTSKRNCTWGSHFNICFGIMKTLLFWSGSSHVIIAGARNKVAQHALSPPPKMFKAMTSAVKILLTISFNVQGPLLVEFLEHRGAINSDMYCKTLQSLCRSFKNKRWGCSRRVWFCSMITTMYFSLCFFPSGTCISSR